MPCCDHRRSSPPSSAIAVGVAELAGAANLGVAFGIGQVCFALALIVLLTRE